MRAISSIRDNLGESFHAKPAFFSPQDFHCIEVRKYFITCLWVRAYVVFSFVVKALIYFSISQPFLFHRDPLFIFISF